MRVGVESGRGVKDSVTETIVGVRLCGVGEARSGADVTTPHAEEIMRHVISSVSLVRGDSMKKQVRFCIKDFEISQFSCVDWRFAARFPFAGFDPAENFAHRRADGNAQPYTSNRSEQGFVWA